MAELPEWASEVRLTIIVEAVIGIGLLLWDELVTAEPWPHAALVALLGTCAAMWLIDRFIKPSLRRQVRGWLDAMGLSVSAREWPGAHFAFKATDPGGFDVVVAQYDKDPGQIEIGAANLLPTPTQLAAFKKLSERERDLFWSRVRLEFFRTGVGFSELTLEGHGVLASLTLPVDDLSEQSLARAMSSVRSIAHVYREILIQELELKPFV